MFVKPYMFEPTRDEDDDEWEDVDDQSSSEVPAASYENYRRVVHCTPKAFFFKLWRAIDRTRKIFRRAMACDHMIYFHPSFDLRKTSNKFFYVD